MPTRILLVRAVNVGGTGKLPMPRFRELLSELGAENVRTYIASGNAVVEAPGGAAFDARVEKALTAEFGWKREVIGRTPAQLRKARTAHPFEVENPKYSYVCPLTSAPTAAARKKALDVPRGDDEWKLIGLDLHLRYANGAGKATLDAAKLLRTLGVQGTARNLTTIEKLLDLASAG